ncbi:MULTISPECIES: lipocalin-like domain-containing protein [unclassified Polaromonas]|uniref:lipocalin-like domain-containing protein n=1 Tax=unclassified Polaromonas TaxID=2638319 RepID=UPI001A192892|nr:MULTISPECIES: lipocalin-like domain-containing protein [unclassified Polaromonas]MBG6071773.1 putative secreted hydrolase [Polaromonas sp. CG_9.7]MBG6113774.1 putative secreted hydrolase [Polaromonas sp. CG_9.2]MDH6184326.1 putative secreted hydrolase [Polaromonas sp. CG_23.6]
MGADLIASMPMPPSNALHRRQMLASLAGMGCAVLSTSVLALPTKTLVFPRDRGAHADFRTEWWYITGQASTDNASARRFGFQLTFFRSRVDGTAQMTSNFAARQLIFAHAAVTDLEGGKLWHDQRIAREGFGVASASQQDMALKLRDWTLTASGPRYIAELPATDFGFSLQFEETQSMLLQGKQGLSRKGPEEKQASYYYSQPQLATRGRLQIKGQTFEVTGKAWLDHEWSEEILAPGAVGWDWTGMNLDDGGALTAFRLRDKDGKAIWAGGSWRSASGELRIFGAGDVTFSPLRHWTSPLTQISYPVLWRVQTPAGLYTIKALLDNQELDSRNSTGSIYWEGLSDLLDGQGKRVGNGYLEMTGYGQALRL